MFCLRAGTSDGEPRHHGMSHDYADGWTDATDACSVAIYISCLICASLLPRDEEGEPYLVATTQFVPWTPSTEPLIILPP
jgi:hypothetical protein